MYARYRWGVDSVIVTSVSSGRAIALHHSNSARTRKKYAGAVVLLRQLTTKDTVHAIMRRLMETCSLTEKGKRRLCRALCKLGIEARVERRVQ